jgi:hypothetical protein
MPKALPQSKEAGKRIRGNMSSDVCARYESKEEILERIVNVNISGEFVKELVLKIDLRCRRQGLKERIINKEKFHMALAALLAHHYVHGNGVRLSISYWALLANKRFDPENPFSVKSDKQLIKFKYILNAVGAVKYTKDSCHSGSSITFNAKIMAKLHEEVDGRQPEEIFEDPEASSKDINKMIDDFNRDLGVKPKSTNTIQEAWLE